MNKIKKGLGFAIGVALGAASVFSYQELDKKLQPTTFLFLKERDIQ